MNIIPEMYNETNHVQRREAHWLLGMIQQDWTKRTPAVVVDVGCGTGNLSLELLATLKCGSIVGIDNSYEMIQFARKSSAHDKARFEVVDVGSEWDAFHESVGLTTESADLVFSNYCLHWVVNQQNALNNICRLLKPGGLFYATVLLWSEAALLEYQFLRDTEWRTYFDDDLKFSSPHMRLERPEAGEVVNHWKSMCTAAGFSNISVEVHEMRGIEHVSFESLKASLTIFLHFVNMLPEDVQERYKSDYFNYAHDNFYVKILKERDPSCTEFTALKLRVEK